MPVAAYTPPPPWWSPEATAGWHGWEAISEATGAALQRALRTTQQRVGSVAAPWWGPIGGARSGGGSAGGGEAAAPVRVHVAPPGAAAAAGAVQQQQQQQQPEQQPEPQQLAQPEQPQGAALMEAVSRPPPRAGSREDIPGHLWLSQSSPEPQMSEARRRQLAMISA